MLPTTHKWVNKGVFKQAPLCKGIWRARRDGRIVANNLSVKTYGFATFPYTGKAYPLSGRGFLIQKAAYA